MTQPLRIALLGAGALGRAWSKVIAASDGAQLSAVVDPLVGSAEAPQPIPEWEGLPSARSLAELGDVPLDAAVVTAFSPAHATAVRAALDRGLNVIVEKPFTTTLPDAQALVDLAAQRGLTLMVSQNYRFLPGVATIRNAVRAETYGRIRAVAGQFWCDWAGKPYQHAMRHVMALEMAIHHFDLVRALFDAEPAEGAVREWNPEPARFAGGGGLEALFEMRGPHGAFPFVYSGSLVGRARLTPWPGLWRFEFDRATLVVETIEERYGLYHATAEGFDWIGPFGDEVVFTASFAHFIDSLRAGREPWSSGHDNLGTMAMALAHTRAAT